jgi:hypothetical protein
MMSTYLQLHEIAAEMYLSPHTVRAQSKSIYRKLDAFSRNQAITRPGNWDCWRSEARLYPHLSDVTRPGMRCDGVMAREVREVRDQAVGFQEILRKLAMIHEGFVQDKARLELDLART